LSLGIGCCRLFELVLLESDAMKKHNSMPTLSLLILVLLLISASNPSKILAQSPLPIISKTDSLRQEIIYQELLTQRKSEIQRYFFFFLAGFSLLMLITLLFKSIVNNWESAYLYGTTTFLFNFLNTLCWTDVIPTSTFLGELKIGFLGLVFNQMVPISIIMLYRSFLNTKIERPRLFKFMTITALALLVFNLGMLLQFFVPSTKIYFVSEHWFEVIFLASQWVLAFAFLRYWRHPIFRYTTWSSWAIALSFLVYFPIQRGLFAAYIPFWFNPVYVLFVALMVDGCLFLFALTLRDKLVAADKIRLEQQATVNELKALRSQMNPHFIFNALNSIKSYALNHDTDGVSFYLTKFSKLMRQVLDNSRSEKITLKRELEMLSLYLDMEKLRVGDKFDFEINVQPDIESDFIELPPMLIQPYVENSIWHGLMHKQTKGKVIVTVTIEGESFLIIHILDNGIGRANAAELRSKTGSNHKSFGMKITAERLGNIKQLYDLDITIEVKDLQDTESAAIGTLVTLKIPV
jgi:hypothetical protein